MKIKRSMLQINYLRFDFLFSTSTFGNDRNRVEFITNPVFFVHPWDWLTSIDIWIILWCGSLWKEEYTKGKERFFRTRFACSNINKSKFSLILKHWNVMLITHCSLIIFTNCFGFGRQNCEHWSYWVLMTTSLELSVFFNFNPKRRRWRRASMKVGNKAKMKVILMTRLIIFKISIVKCEFWSTDAGL